MRQLRDRGVSLIFVTHFLDQVYQVSDRITVLRNGSFVGCRETCKLPQIELVKMMLGAGWIPTRYSVPGGYC